MKRFIEFFSLFLPGICQKKYISYMPYEGKPGRPCEFIGTLPNFKEVIVI